jgi:hypothetical protein
MNSDLYNLLIKPITINYSIEKEFTEDDFNSRTRINRIFTNKQKELCWKKAMIIPGRDPDRWRIDAAGNFVLKALKGCQGPLCHEYDHIVPFSKGGETVLRNCQILQTSANKFKSDKTFLKHENLKKKSSKINLSDYEMDVIEESIYGSVNRKYI